MSNLKNNQRPIEKMVEEHYSLWGKSFVFIKKTQIKSWQAIFIIAFVSGLATALIWVVAMDIQSYSKAALSANGLVGYYTFDEGSGTTANDSSGNNNTGTLMPTASNGPTWITGTNTKVGAGALSFDGVNSYVEAPNQSSLNVSGNQITVSAWIYRTNSDSNPRIILAKPVSGSSHISPYFSYSTHLLNGNTPSFWVATGGSGSRVTSSVPVSANVWHFVTGVYNGTNILIYVDGVQTGSVAKSGSLNTYATPLRIGTNGGLSEKFQGNIDEVRIYNRALSDTEIQNLYNYTGIPYVTNGSSLPVTLGTPIQFNLPTAGTYKLVGTVNASSEGTNSVYIDIDSDPGTTDTSATGRIWDMAVGVASQDANWRGANPPCTSALPDCVQYNPKTWTLSTGAHTLYANIREAGTQLTALQFVSYAIIQPQISSFSASPSSVISGQRADLSWKTVPAAVSSCTLSGDGPTKSVPISTNYYETQSITATTTFTLTCTGAAGTIPASKSVTITVIAPPPTYTVTVNKLGTGAGSIASSVGNVSCVTATCTITNVPAGNVTLTANSNPGSVFNIWTSVSGCSTNPVCTFNLTANKTITATFNLDSDMTPPVVTAFSAPTTSTSYTISLVSITATDAGGVTGYLITESAAKPSAATGWTSAVTSYTVNPQTNGIKTLYAWAKDLAGNVSNQPAPTISPKSVNVTVNSDMTGWWKFDEGQGTTANDSAGTNIGALINSPTWTTGIVESGALQFNGVGNYVEMPDQASLDISGNQITVSAWIYRTNSDSNPHIIVAKPVSGSSHISPYFSYSTHLLNGNTPSFWVATGGSGSRVTSSVPVSANVWHFVTGVYNGTNILIYVDGVQTGSVAKSGNLNTYTTPLRIGTNGNLSEKFQGKIDDARIYPRALTPSEIIGLYNLVPPQPNITSFSANPTSVPTAGQTSILTWSSTNATSCTGTGFSTGGAVSNPTGVFVTPTAPSTTYTITCSGVAGTIPATRNVTVTVGDVVAGNTYYIDYNSGSNTNNGTSKATPWKVAPGMNGWTCTGSCSYSHQAGVRFIFKGGVTWPAAASPLNIIVGGSSESVRDYYGVDKSWYSGVAWARPIFDGQYTTSSLIVLAQGIKYITLDNFEAKNIMAQAKFGPALVSLTTNENITISNCYLHGWTLNPSFLDDDAHGGVIGIYWSGTAPVGVIIDSCEISNTEFSSTKPNGVAIRQIDTVRNSVIHDVPTAILFARNIHDNEFYNINWPYPDFDGGGSDGEPYHTNLAYMDGWDYRTVADKVGYFYNNIVRDWGNGAAPIYPNPQGGKTIYVYNNLVYGHMSTGQSAIEIDPYAYGAGGDQGTVYVYDNTIVSYELNAPGIHVVNRGGSPRLGTLVARNNHIIGVGAFVTDGSQGSTVGSLTVSNNLIQTPTEATNGGYTLANLFKPTTSLSQTVNTGTPITCTICTDIDKDFLGVSRQQGLGWDIGAYEYTGTTGNMYYVRAGATGTTCSDWSTANACNSLPATLQRGATYYIADGSYPGYTFNDAVDGTKVITIKKAIATDHGTSIGWLDSYGDGEAVWISSWNVWTFGPRASYYNFSGQFGEGKNPKGFGFRLYSTGSRNSTLGLVATDTSGTYSETGGHTGLVFDHIEFDLNNGTPGGVCSAASAFLMRPANPTSDFTLKNSYLHHGSGGSIFMNRGTNIKIENNYFYEHGDETNAAGVCPGADSHAHWEIFWFTNINGLSFKNNVIENAFSAGQTGWLMIGGINNAKIYNNVFFCSSSNSCNVGGNGVIATWSHDYDQNSNVYIYHNTILNLINAKVLFMHSTAVDVNVVAKNNLYYNANFGWAGISSQSNEACGGGQSCSGMSPQTGIISSIFRNYNSNDFGLSQHTNPGTNTLGVEFQYDKEGNLRTNWDRGAYEYQQ